MPIAAVHRYARLPGVVLKGLPLDGAVLSPLHTHAEASASSHSGGSALFRAPRLEPVEKRQEALLHAPAPVAQFRGMR